MSLSLDEKREESGASPLSLSLSPFIVAVNPFGDSAPRVRASPLAELVFLELTFDVNIWYTEYSRGESIHNRN